MKNTHHDKIKLLGNLKISVPFMRITGAVGIVYFAYNLYRFFMAPEEITQSILALVGLMLSILIITKYIILMLKTQKLNNAQLNDAEKLEAYFLKSSQYWIIDGIVSICGIIGLLLILLAQI